MVLELYFSMIQLRNQKSIKSLKKHLEMLVVPKAVAARNFCPRTQSMTEVATNHQKDELCWLCLLLETTQVKDVVILITRLLMEKDSISWAEETLCALSYSLNQMGTLFSRCSLDSTSLHHGMGQRFTSP